MGGRGGGDVGVGAAALDPVGDETRPAFGDGGDARLPLGEGGLALTLDLKPDEGGDERGAEEEGREIAPREVVLGWCGGRTRMAWGGARGAEQTRQVVAAFHAKRSNEVTRLRRSACFTTPPVQVTKVWLARQGLCPPTRRTDEGAPLTTQSRSLDVIAEHELLGVRREVDLVGDVGYVEPRHVVIDEGDGHDQRDQAMGKVLDEVAELELFAGGEPLLEKSHDVLEYVDVLARGRRDGERPHEAFLVAGEPLRAGQAREIAEETPQLRVVDRAVGEEEELVRGVEGHDVPWTSAVFHEGAQPTVGENPRDEVVAKPGIGQAPFSFHGPERIRVQGALEEEATAGSRRHARIRVDLHALHAAGGRGALEDVAGEPEGAQLAHSRPRVGFHGLGQVCLALGGEEARRRRVPDETDGLARGA